MIELKEIKELVSRKREIDKITKWSKGSVTYLEEIQKEIEEVTEEIPKDRINYLEDELCDVLWDYLNLVSCLEAEKGVSLDRILSRTVTKYTERIEGKFAGELWADIKARQKLVLEKEYQEILKLKS